MNLHQQLNNHYLFSQLGEPQLERVVNMCSIRQLQDGEKLFDAGDHASHFFMVVNGQIKLTRLAPSGNEKVIELIAPGNLFAEALMFADTPAYPVTATAIEKALLIAIDNKAFVALLRESVDSCFRMMSAMSQRLHHMIKEIDDLTLQSASGRVAAFLCARYAEGHRQSDEFELDAPKGILASRLSVQPETFSRILGSFASQGLLSVKGSRVAILDPQGLRAMAESSGLCQQTPLRKKP